MKGFVCFAETLVPPGRARLPPQGPGGGEGTGYGRGGTGRQLGVPASAWRRPGKQRLAAPTDSAPENGRKGDIAAGESPGARVAMDRARALEVGIGEQAQQELRLQGL